MTAGLKQRPALPLTLSAALDARDWLANPWWPTRQRDLRDVVKRSLPEFHAALQAAPPDLAPILRLIAPAAASWSAALDSAAFLVSHSRSLRLAGEASLLQRSLLDVEAQRLFLQQAEMYRNPPMRRLEAELRHLARTLSWSRPSQVMANTIRPRIMAVTHNSLLMATARNSTSGVGFRQGDFLLDRARNLRPAVATDVAQQAAEYCVSATGPRDFPDDIEHNRISLLLGLMRNLAQLAESDLASLRDERLPDEIWTGTFGKWSSRAVGLTVLERGGKVVSFDHGGSVATANTPARFQIVEICGGAHFSVCSPMAADITRTALLPPDVSSTRIIAGPGDPSFKSVALPARPMQSKRRVVYATTIYRGDRQFHWALLPDPVYLHWQRQVLLSLKRMPIDPLFKPHPEGLLTGQANPLADIVPTSTRPFESHLADAHCLVFDYPNSTTFWKAMCSNCAVVFLDLGVGFLTSATRQMVSDRARVLQVYYDAYGMPNLNQEEFHDAIMNTRPGDPGPFRALLCAEPSRPSAAPGPPQVQRFERESRP